MMPSTSQNGYGADNNGLICSYVFSASGSQELSASAAQDWLAQPIPHTQCLWLHLNLSHPNCAGWLKTHMSLPEAFFESWAESEHATRIEHIDNTLMAIINDVVFDFDFDANDIATLWVAVTPHVVVTARSKPLRSIDRLRMALKSGAAPSGTVALLVHLLQDQADVLTQVIRDLTSQTNGFEDRVLANRLDNSNSLSNIRRLLVRLQRLLAPEPAALFRLLTRPPTWIAEEYVDDLRQSTEEFATVIQDISALHERIKLLQEEIARQINTQNNRSLFVLTVVSVLALPINILAGLFGMNVGGIPLAENRHGFWLLVLVVLAFTSLAAYGLLRRKWR